MKNPPASAAAKAAQSTAAGRTRTTDVSVGKTRTRKEARHDPGQSTLVPAVQGQASTFQQLPQVAAEGVGLIGGSSISAGPASSAEPRMQVRGLDAASPGFTAWAAPGHRERVASSFDALVGHLMPALVELDPVPYAMVQQAQRRAALRTELLASGAYTYRALAAGRAMSGPAVRQWVRRARERCDLFTVEHDNETLVPALLLDADLSPRPQFRAVIQVLTEAGEDGWGLWAWLVYPTPGLDGAVPGALLFNEPEVVLAAALQRADNAA
ncbi:MAG TPA: hypothetical protein VME46_05610 [Acidimicrobiales bacterium]|nr:hypothetical protein [Acidimicrobiales bacterium]